MTKKQLLFLFSLVMPFVVQTQQVLPKFGYFNLSTLMKAVSEYATAQGNITDLRIKYDAETRGSEDGFNKKYEEFLDGQCDFAPIIIQKCQAELQNMTEKNIAFKKEVQQLLAEARHDAITPVKGKMLATIRRLGQERGYASILNADNDTLPYIDVAYGDNLNDAALSLLAQGGK